VAYAWQLARHPFVQRAALSALAGWYVAVKTCGVHLRVTKSRENGQSKLEHSGTMVAMSGYRGGKILGPAIASAESKPHKKARAVAPDCCICSAQTTTPRKPLPIKGWTSSERLLERAIFFFLPRQKPKSPCMPSRLPGSVRCKAATKICRSQVWKLVTILETHTDSKPVPKPRRMRCSREHDRLSSQKHSPTRVDSRS
jgi:hypothetical protein